MTVTASRVWRSIGSDRSVVLPKRNDPRLHTAAVIISVHVIGITALGFRVSVPQILAAMISAGALEVVLTYRRTGEIVWPASGLLTGSGVALILRLTDMKSGDYWSWDGWYYFALVAGFSLLTKYVIRFRGNHVFNPSNVGLVLAFLILGVSRVEPLDFWWAPMDIWMALTYAVIIGGGVAITRRLGLLEMASTFWIVLMGGLGVLVLSGHCMTAAWAVDPVCGGRFWVLLATSPEVLIFLFFMITDPKTIPKSRLARLIFAATLGAFAALLIAPQTVEFGTKVALLGSLTILSPISPALDRMLPDRGTSQLGVVELADRLSISSLGGTRAFVRGAALGSLPAVVAVAILSAGTQEAARPFPQVPFSPAAVGVEVDPNSLPMVNLTPEVESADYEVDQQLASRLAITLAENLAVEAKAIKDGDQALLRAVLGGKRLSNKQEEIGAANPTGHSVTHQYHFETLTLGIVENRRQQTSAALALEGTGVVESVVHDESGQATDLTRSEFSLSFLLRRLGGDRWLLVDILDNSTPAGENR